MKRTAFLFAWLLVVPALAGAQSQTRDRRSSDSEAPRTGSTTVRDRIVGPTRAANHVEKLKTNQEETTVAPSNPAPALNSSSLTNQNSVEPKWGNTALVVRSGPAERSTPPSNSPANKQKSVDRGDQPVKKLVQQTSSVPALKKPLSGTSTNSTKSVVGGGAPTVIYHVGVGDVLDIRLTNLPTRESTLYTVLKSGFLEYPLLTEPLPVAGMTTDAIANLLSNQIKVIKTVRVSVSVRDYASHVVVITGLVDSPGRKTMRREAMPLFAVLSEALPRPEANLATIIRDGKSQTLSFRDEPAMATLVLAGDVIRISGGINAATRFVYVGGDVASRGEKEFRDGMTLTQAVLSAGGAVQSRQTRVRVARRDPNGFLRSNEYNLQLIEAGKSQDPLLEAGDRIEVTRSM